MIGVAERQEAIDEIVDALADSRLCVLEQPERFELRVLEVAELNDIGVTNVMGQVSRLVAASSRFNETRKAAILRQLYLRGAGAPQPALRCY